MGARMSLCEAEAAASAIEDASPEAKEMDVLPADPEPEPELEPEPEEEPEEEIKEIRIETAPFDPRFVTTNQARHCYTRYNEFHKCVKEKGEDSTDCTFYAKAYRSLCPGDWIEKWNEEREAGTFAGKY